MEKIVPEAWPSVNQNIELPSIPNRTFVITDFGAAGDGVTDNTEAFRLSIEACHQAGGGKVVIPPGVWSTGPIVLKSRINLHAEAGALISFSQCRDDYPLIYSTFEGLKTYRCQSPLDGEGLEDIAITGQGIFDGGGEVWRPVKKMKLNEREWEQLISKGGVVDNEEEVWWPSASAMNGRTLVDRLDQEGCTDKQSYEASRDYLRPALLSLRKCNRILLEAATFQNSAAWCLHPWASKHLTIRSITVRNPWYAQNGDGLDLDSCSLALVENCMFDVGDDAICLKSGKDKPGRDLGIPCEDISVRGCVVYHGHGGVVIGSEMSGGVRRVHITDCTFIGTDIGIRFKSARGRGGIVEDIIIQNIRMREIAGDAISMNMFYNGHEGSGIWADDKYPISDETPIFRNIRMEGIVCLGAESAVYAGGLSEMPLSNMEISSSIFQCRRGIKLAHAQHFQISDVQLYTDHGPMIELHQCRSVTAAGVKGESREEGERQIAVFGAKTADITVRRSVAESMQIITGQGVLKEEIKRLSY